MLTTTLALFTSCALATEGPAITLHDQRPWAVQTPEIRVLVSEHRQAKITTLKALLSSGTLIQGKPELMQRLASYYFDQGLDILLCRTTKGCDTKALSPDHRASDAWFQMSNKLNQVVAERYPKWAGNDKSLFLLGSSQLLVGDHVGRSTLQSFVERYPDSAFRPRAFMLLGDDYFAGNEPLAAVTAYLVVTQNPEDPDRDYATYKLAWSYFRLGEHDKSVAAMRAVVSATQSAEPPDARTLQLHRAAFADLVFFSTRSRPGKRSCTRGRRHARR